MGKKKLAVLTGDRNNGFFFLQENVWPLSRAAQKSNRYNQVPYYRGGCKAGLHCIGFVVAFFSI